MLGAEPTAVPSSSGAANSERVGVHVVRHKADVVRWASARLDASSPVSGGVDW